MWGFESGNPEFFVLHRYFVLDRARQLDRDKPNNRWVEAIEELEHKVESSTRIIHVFDREGDITEVFDPVGPLGFVAWRGNLAVRTPQLKHTGVLVRASHNRSLDQNSQRLWDVMTSQPISFEQDINLPATAHRQARKTKLAIRFAPVPLRTPYRFDNRHPINIYAVYATEIDCY